MMQSARHQELARIEMLAHSGRLDEAIALTERHVRLGSKDAEFLRVRALLEQRAGRMGAGYHYASAAEAIESHPDTLLFLAHADSNAGRTDEALDRCRKVLAAEPGSVAARMLMAQALESAVRVREANEVLDSLAADVGGRDLALQARIDQLRAMLLVHEKRSADAVALLDRTILSDGAPAPPELRRQGWYLRAKACDRMERWDDAFESAAKANAIGEPSFDPSQYEAGVAALMGHWNRASMREFPTSGSATELPVFIAGMPRSGTSLLDQVIDAHGQAAGVGEMAIIEHFARNLESVWDASLPAPDSFGPLRDRAFRNAASAYEAECRRQAPGARRVVNKALGNNRIVGLIARLFPRTRIIHAIRDPRDVAVSCFMGGFNNDFYPWTARLEWIAAAWHQSRVLMEHWKRETDLPIIDVRYEDVVTDPGTQFPRVVDFLGLEWDEGCTRFHESRRTVRTLSYDQVNRPLYSSSVERWRHYEKFLRGVEWPEYR